MIDRSIFLIDHWEKAASLVRDVLFLVAPFAVVWAIIYDYLPGVYRALWRLVRRVWSFYASLLK